MQHFFVHFFAVVLHDFNGNFQKLPSYRFFGVNVVRLVHFFLLSQIFTLVAASISHFLTAATNFSCCSSNKKCLLCFLSPRCSSLSIFFLDNTDIETVSAFRFRLYWLFSWLCFTRRGWQCDSRRLRYLVIELFYIGMPVVRSGGRSVGRTVTWLPKFITGLDYARARSSAINWSHQMNEIYLFIYLFIKLRQKIIIIHENNIHIHGRVTTTDKPGTVGPKIKATLGGLDGKGCKQQATRLVGVRA